MSTSPKVTPRDFVLWVFSMGTLVASIVSFIGLLFEYINRLVGDVPVYDVYSTGIRIAMATLITVFPLYIWSTRYLNEDIRQNSEKRDLWVRKWLIYIGLFVAAITLIVDLIVLINAYLGGEDITAAFLLKVLTVLVVVGSAFLYYLRSLAGVWEKREDLSKTIGYIVAALVFFTVVSGFFIIGSPREQRLLRQDQERVAHLQDVQWRVTNFYQQKGALPTTMDELADPLSGYVIPLDPETGARYEYTVVPTKPLTFELCATFAQKSVDATAESSAATPVYYEGMYGSPYWTHEAGRTCFERTIDPDQYPVYEKAAAARTVPAVAR